MPWLVNLRKALLKGLLLTAIGLIYLYGIVPLFKISIPCIFHDLTGLYCSGCGMTRAANALLHGNLYQAFRYNMIIFCLSPFLIVYFSSEHIGAKRLSKALLLLMLIMAFAFGILRNTSVFSWMAPLQI